MVAHYPNSHLLRLTKFSQSIKLYSYLFFDNGRGGETARERKKGGERERRARVKISPLYI